MSDDTASFGPYVLDRRREQLTRGGSMISIGHRGIVLLDTLLEAAGQTVTKAELLERAWPGLVVEEGNLTVQIAALRKAIGEDFIITVPRVGYKLAAPAAESATSLAEVLPSLAVLPFANRSGDPEQTYFADGVAEDITTALSRFASFAVVARNSAFVFRDSTMDIRDIARELRVRYVLEGSVRRAAERLRITAQLVDAGTGNHLWGHTFDGGVDDIFAFQDEIAASVTALVAPRIEEAELAYAQRERPGSASAYDLYLQALHKVGTNRSDESVVALDLLERALALEPDFVSAIGLAAHAREMRNSWGWPPYRADDHEEALRLARRALELANDDAVALARAGLVVLQIGGELDLAIRTLERAAELNPYNSFVVHHAGVCHLLGGDLNRSAYYFKRAARLNLAETADIAMTGLAMIELCQGDFERAVDWAVRAISANRNQHPAHWMRIAGLAHQGRLDEAKRALSELLVLVPDLTLSRLRAGNARTLAERWQPIFSGLALAGLPEA